MVEPATGTEHGKAGNATGRRRVEISLLVLIPFILGGLAALPLLAADTLWPGLFIHRQVGALCLLAGGTVYAMATGLLLWVRRPIRRFIDSARSIPLLPPVALSPKRRGDDLLQLEGVFDQVVEALSAMDARSLFPDMVGESRVMRGVFSQLLKVAATEATVLLLGDSGTGKELAAASVHDKSARAKGPFVAVNCAAIPEGLLESELFGHEKGAFTGAVGRKIGKFEQAAGGTLFLDEIGDMPLDTQSKILRALEARQCERVGGNRPVVFDVRIVAATHHDLPAMIGQGRFREDLYHRLNVFPVRLPPLRERREDIPLLAERFLEACHPGARLSLGALQRLLAYSWPGNARELKNAMERAAVLLESDTVEPRHLPALSGGSSEATTASDAADLDSRLAVYEKSLIEAALSQTDGVQSKAAALLGIKERSLWHRVKKLGIDPSVFKSRCEE
ncbi:MAG: sigma-54 interaction domain-containing protein [Solidesulfovibrio sp.]